VNEIPAVSVVLPVYRCRPMLDELHRRLVAALESIDTRFELIFVDDASPDGSNERLQALAARDPRVRLITHGIRLGQHAALLDGLASSRGQVVVTLDADLQDPPEAIPDLLRALADGYGAVYAGRRGRYESRARLATSWVFKHAISLVTGMPADAGAFIAMRRDVASRILTFPGSPPYVTAAAAWAGRPVASVPVVRGVRPGGESSFTAGMRMEMGAKALAQAVRWRLTRVPRQDP
jgi:glycosyltransferase involved in cell wall biosynthesis